MYYFKIQLKKGPDPQLIASLKVHLIVFKCRTNSRPTGQLNKVLVVNNKFHTVRTNRVAWNINSIGLNVKLFCL